MGKTNTSFTWLGQHGVPPTQAEMVASQIALAEEAARLERVWRDRFDNTTGGTPECAEAHDMVAKYRSDQRHFRRAANWHREQHLLEQREKNAAEARAAEIQRRSSEGLPPPVERVVGEDDGDDERQSPWADIGRAV
jgi:hypothetical protein